MCFDCKKKNPKWASANIGIFLCYDCTSNHRNFGVHISFVRSLKMDRWKAKELKCMELGGNKLAAQYYERNSMTLPDGTPNHKSPALSKYKLDLGKKAEVAILGQPVPTAPAQQQPVEVKQEHAKVVSQMGSLTFATSSGKDDIFGGFTSKPEESKSFKEPVLANLTQPKLVAMNSGSGNSSGLFGLAKQAAPTDVKTLNAKKLDVNFDADDFFNSFQPAAVQESKPAGSSKLQEVSDPFEIAPKPASKATVEMSFKPLHQEGRSSDLDA